jgi:hypothetical protein
MIAAIVLPFGSRSIASTASCLEEDGAAAFADAGFEVTALDEAVDLDRAATVLLVGPFAVREDLRAVVVFDLRLLVAIWLSLVRATASGAATDTSPRWAGRGRGGNANPLRVRPCETHNPGGWRDHRRAGLRGRFVCSYCAL